MGAAVKSMRSGKRTQAGTKAARTVQSPIDKAKGYEVVWPQVSPLFEAARPIDGCPFVYFIGEPDNGMVKIGLSKDPIGRLRTMQTGNPRRLRIEHVLVGDMHTEKLLHEFWEQHAVKSARAATRTDAAPGTEWFDPAVRDMLAPIITTAAERQAERLNRGGDITTDELERIVRDAHYHHGFKPPVRDEVRVLATVGYVTLTRRTRI